MVNRGGGISTIQRVSIAALLALTSLPVDQGFGAPVENLQRRVRPISPLTAVEIASKYLPGVVLIRCDDGMGNSVQGSGFFISPEKIVTNYHIIQGMVRGYVKLAPLPGRTRTRVAITSILDFDREEDLALLSIAESLSIRASPEANEMLALSKLLKEETDSKTDRSSNDPLGIHAFLEQPSIPPLAPPNQTVKVGEKIYALGNPLD
jgi:hypothetical protein